MATGPDDDSFKIGENFVDELRRDAPIPPSTTWDELTTNQLIDLKAQLEDKLWTFAKNPVMSRTLKEGVRKVSVLLEVRLASS